MKYFKRAIALVGVLALIVGLWPAMTVDASSAALSIVPRKNYTVEPGKTIRDTLTIRNIDRSQPLELNLRVIDFTFFDDGGSPQLMLAENAPQTVWSLKPFLTVPATATIPAGQSKTLDISLTIPEGQGAGSYYSAIVYSSGAPADGGNVGLNASGVTLVFTNIPGEVDEKLELEKLGAYDTAAREFVYFAVDEPFSIGYTLKNSGNVAQSPIGTIKLRHMFGQEIDITNINPNGSLALRDQTRTFTTCIKLKSQEVDFNGSRSEATTCASPGLWPGYYSVNMDLFYGQNGNITQEIVGKASFWYLPWWFIISVVGGLLIATYIVWTIVERIRGKLHGTPTRRLPGRKSKRK